MKGNVVFAIFRRNFVSYFSSPTGYVFLCVFVLLSGFAAFWPHEFFNANLANLDQLNKYLPYIMLVFIPAITMSVWAEERRLGTDELLLTIPASDLDVVVGKYLAAAAIFSVSLLFSGISNFCVLGWLGEPDVGLFMGMYFGYWMVGMAMLAVGMIASFLTNNLTVGFILGAAFNAPLVFAANASVILPSEVAHRVARWSIEGQFRDFGRGVISLSSVAFFALIVLVSLYVCMVLIGRRHWAGGRSGSMFGHYLVRTLSLVVLAVSLTLIFSNADFRLDVTSENLNSLSSDTRQLVEDLETEYPVVVEAFISPISETPESYVQTRQNLLATLQELGAIGGRNMEVQIHDTRAYSDEAFKAEEQYDIEARRVGAQERGAYKEENLYLGVVFRSGLEKVVIPFFDRGLPVEYELVRSIATVASEGESQRKRLGLLQTGAGLMGSFNPATMSQDQKQDVVEELEKQYDVIEVDPSEPITERFDVLMAVQPSSLGPPEMENFINAVRSGQPTAIFEDPMPVFLASVEGTEQPKRPPGGMMGMFGGQQPQPKGDIKPLWDMLGVDFFGGEIVRQEFNPHPKMQQFPEEFVFVTPQLPGAKEPLSGDSKITSNLQELLFCFPGYVRRGKATGLKYEPLVFTSEDLTSTIKYSEATDPFMGRMASDPERAAKSKRVQEELVLAARITGKLKKTEIAFHEGDEDHEHAEEAADDEPELDVVLVSDIDCLASQFFDLRAMGQDPGMEVFFNFDNVTFVLNVLDVLAGDERFVEVRKRRPKHRTLLRLEQAVAEATEESTREILQARSALEKARERANEELQEEIAKLRREFEKGNIDQAELLRRIAIKQKYARGRLDAQMDVLENETNTKIKRIERELNKEIQSTQDWYKMWAVAAPPIFPLLMGIVVFFNRRAKEKEGVARTRLR